MNYARRLDRRAALRKARRSAVKDQIRRGLMAERLEDRSLMAADLSSFLSSAPSPYWNINKPTDVNADGIVAPSDALAIINNLNSQGSHQLGTGASGEGETTTKLYVDVNNDGFVSPADALAVINNLNGEGDTTPEVGFTLNILNSAGQVQTGTPTIQQGQDFYLQFVGQDLRTAVGFRGVSAAYADVLLSDKSLFSYAVNEVQTLTLTAASAGSFTLSNVGLGNLTTGSINFDPADTATTATNIAAGLNATLGANSVTVLDNQDGTFAITFSAASEINKDMPLMQASTGATIAETVKGAPLTTVNVNGTHLAAITYNQSKLASYNNQLLGTDAADRIDELGAFSADKKNVNPIEVLRVHMIANALPAGTPSATENFTLKVTGTTGVDATDPDGIVRPADNTLVFANPGESSDVAVDAIKLTNASVQITSGPISASNFTAGTINEDSGADTIDLLSHTALNPGSTGTIIIKSVQGLSAGAGQVVLNGNSAVYTPAQDFNGSATFTYTAQLSGDSDPTHLATATVTVPVTAVNDAPTISAPASTVQINEDNVLTFSGANAVTVADVDGGSADEQVTLTAANGIVTLATTNGLSTNTGNGTGLVTMTGPLTALNAALAGATFTPAQDFNGSTSVVVNINDQGNTGTGGALQATKTVSISIAAVNDPPVNQLNGTAIVNGTHIVAIPNQAFNFASHGKTFTVLDVDTTNLSVTVSLASAAQGTLQVTGQSAGTSVSLSGTQSSINTALASLTYTPPNGSVAPAVMTFTTSDGVAAATVSTLNIDLDPGVRPFPLDDSFQFNEGTTSVQNLDVLSNDFKAAGATTTIVSVGTPQVGGTPEGSVVISADNLSLNYTPPADTDFFTPASPVQFTYTIHDTVAGSTDRTATVSINFKNIPDAPLGTADNYSTKIGTSLPSDPSRNVLSNDTDVDNNYGVTNYATLTVKDTGARSTTGGGTATLAANGTFSYTPAAGFLGDDTFTYTVRSTTPEGSVDATNPTTVKIHVASPPIQSNSSVTGQEDTALPISVDSSYSDPTENKPLTAVQIVTNVPANTGTVTINGDGKSFTYTPAANFNTTRPAANPITFTYIAIPSDGSGRPSNVATVSITVNEVNDPPTAVDDGVPTPLIVVKQNAAGTIGVNQPITSVLNNDSVSPDVAINGDESLSVVGVGLSANGPFSTGPVTTALGGIVNVVVVGGVPQIQYTSPQTTGADSFFYQISDNSSPSRGGPLLASAKVNLNVVDFVPKHISGTVYVDSNNNGVLDDGESRVSGVTVTLTGTSFDSATANNVNISTKTDLNGNYTFGNSDIIKPPKAGTSYTITETDPSFFLTGAKGGIDTNNATNVDTNTDPNLGHVGPVVTNSNFYDNKFLLSWSITDQSGDVNGLNFGEKGVDVNTLQSSSGYLAYYLASTGQDGFVIEADPAGNSLWGYSVAGWENAASLKAVLNGDQSLLTLSGFDKQNNAFSVTLNRNVNFFILGYSGNQYIIGVVGSPSDFGLDLLAAVAPGGGEGEAQVNPDFAASADAVFAAEGAWA